MTRHRAAWTFFLAACCAALLPLGIARADDPPPVYRSVAKWRVAYTDVVLGEVHGDAYCRFTSAPPTWPGVVDPQPHCKVRLFDPITGKISDLVAKAGDITHPAAAGDPFRLRMTGDSPMGTAKARPTRTDYRLVIAHPGAKAEITLEDKTSTRTYTAPVLARAPVDDGRVSLELYPGEGGALAGLWFYNADGVGERDMKGAGRTGLLATQADDAAGGFKARQFGREVWMPLEPRIVAVEVVEDQAGFERGLPLYSLSRHERVTANDNFQRTLAIFGRDLPVLDGEDYGSIRSAAEDGLRYTLVADGQAKNLAPADRVKIEAARKALAARMPKEDAAGVSGLDAVLVRVEQLVLHDPGPRTLEWGGARRIWWLQYGDNIAIPRFARVVREPTPGQDVPDNALTQQIQEAYRRWVGRDNVLVRLPDASLGPTTPAPPPMPDESEGVREVALPERVFIEVETGGKLEIAALPVVVGGAALGDATVSLTATRLEGHPTLYRTPPIVFAARGAASAAGAGDTVVPVTPGAEIFARVDQKSGHFLRVGVAKAHGAPPSDIWIRALIKAAACNNEGFDPANWPPFAMKTAESWSQKFLTVELSYGDHAGLLLLRDALVASLTQSLNGLDVIAAEEATDTPEERLIDGWYRSMAPAVANAPAGWLASVKVASPAGSVPFAKAYDESFARQTFHLVADDDGERRRRLWRREAAHTALDEMRTSMREVLAREDEIETCDRQGLLKLAAGAVGTPPDGVSHAAPPGNLIAAIAPPLMKKRSAAELAEPDFIARAYVANIDQLVGRARSVAEFSSTVNQDLVKVVTAVTAVTGGFALGSLTVVTIGDTVAFGFDVTLTGLALFGERTVETVLQMYQSRRDIAFALANYRTLGLGQYLEVEGVEGEHAAWWPAFKSILLDAVETFARVHGGYPFDEAAMTKQGAKVSQRMIEGVRDGKELYAALTDEEKVFLALFTAEEEEFINRTGIVSQAGRGARTVLRKLTVERVPPPATAMEQEQQAAAVSAIDTEAKTQRFTQPLFNPGPLPAPETQRLTQPLFEPGPLSAPETQVFTSPKFAPPSQSTRIFTTPKFAPLIPETVIGQAGREAEVVAETAAAAVKPVEAAVTEIPKLTQPFMRELGEAIAPGFYTMPVRGGGTATFAVKGYVASGEFAHVYELASTPTGLPRPLIPGLVGKRLALKTLKPWHQIKEFRGFANENDEARELARISEDTGLRMKRAEETLVAGGRQVVPHVPFQVFEEEGFVLQEFVEEDANHRFLPKGLTEEQFRATVPKADRQLMAQLAKRIWSADVEARDLHPENIVMELENGTWVAKILDPDFVERFGGQRLAANEEWHEYTIAQATFTSDVITHNERTPMEAMMKAVERKGWLHFDPSKSNKYLSGYLEPGDFGGVLPEDWPYLVGVDLPPPPVPTQQPMLYAGEAMRDFLDLMKRKGASPDQPPAGLR